MIGIDTNVLVRYFTQDDKLQSDKASNLINQYIDKNNSLFISNIVMCELVWVLQHGYKYSKTQIITLLKELLVTQEFSFEDHKILWLTTIEYEKSEADFADILISKINSLNGYSNTFTFDSKASTLSEFTLIE